LSVFLASILIEFVSWIGFSVIASTLYLVYRKLFQSKEFNKQAKLKSEIVVLRNDLSKTSSMDEFAKWAKIRRKIDSKQAEFEKIVSALAMSKSSFQIQTHLYTRIIFYSFYIYIIYTYQTTAMFYLPEDWLGFTTSFLSLPFAPKGSVSVVVWVMACRKFV
ncbi:WRB/Get1 family, partial [Paraphysoderma sedebokerense]